MSVAQSQQQARGLFTVIAADVEMDTPQRIKPAWTGHTQIHSEIAVDQEEYTCQNLA